MRHDPGALFLSKDHGKSWSLNEPLWNLPERKDWMGGGFDNAGVASICVDPRDASHITVGVSTGGVWATSDGGEHWHAASDGMHADYFPPPRHLAPEVQDIHRLVQCPAAPDTMWVQHHNGVFRSTDARALVAGGHHDPPVEVRLRRGGASARSRYRVVRAGREG